MKDKNIIAAIALALHEHNGNNVHDKESCVITIQRHNTEWNAHTSGMTGTPHHSI